MRSKSTFIRSAAAVALIAGAAAGPFAAASDASSGRTRAAARSARSLIANGGFERPVLASDSYSLYTPGETFTGWRVVGPSGSNVAMITGDFQQNGFYFDAQAGKQWMDLTGTSDLINRNLAGVAQTVATTRKAQYMLTFYVGNVYNPSGIFGTRSTVEVSLDGKRVLLATNAAGAGSSRQVWMRFRLSFRASSARTTVAFLNYDPASDTSNGIDSVSLVQTSR